MLEARCRAPTTTQRDVKRARIVLLAEGRSIRSIRAAHFQQLVAAPEMRRLDVPLAFGSRHIPLLTALRFHGRNQRRTGWEGSGKCGLLRHHATPIRILPNKPALAHLYVAYVGS